MRAASIFFALTSTSVVTTAALAPACAWAQAGDPAAAQVQRFDDALLATMKQGRQLGFEGRYRRLDPAVKETFDLPIMVRFAVGPTTWPTLSASDQSALLTAFTRFSVSTWAKNFASYSGQQFTLGKVDTRGPDKLVHTQLVGSSGSGVELVYRMRQSSGGAWKIIDVYFNGSISQLSQQRSDFAATLQSGGAPALVRSLDAKADQLSKG